MVANAVIMDYASDRDDNKTAQFVIRNLPCLMTKPGIRNPVEMKCYQPMTGDMAA